MDCTLKASFVLCSFTVLPWNSWYLNQGKCIKKMLAVEGKQVGRSTWSVYSVQHPTGINALVYDCLFFGFGRKMGCYWWSAGWRRTRAVEQASVGTNIDASGKDRPVPGFKTHIQVVATPIWEVLSLARMAFDMYFGFNRQLLACFPWLRRAGQHQVCVMVGNWSCLFPSLLNAEEM